MRIIGLDLAITSQHKAVVMDESGKFLTPVFQVSTWPEEVRKRNNLKARRERVEKQAERQFARRERKRESSPEWVRG